MYLQVVGYQVMRGELDGDAHDRLRGLSDDLSSRASIHFYDEDNDTNRLDDSFHRQSKRSSKDQMQHSQKSSFASSSQFSSPRQSNKKDSLQTVNQQDLRLPLRAVSQQETFRSPRSKMGDVPEAWLVFANNSNEHQGGRGGGYGAEQAVPVNLANSIGSRLQVGSTLYTLTLNTQQQIDNTIVLHVDDFGISRPALPT